MEQIECGQGSRKQPTCHRHTEGYEHGEEEGGNGETDPNEAPIG